MRKSINRLPLAVLLLCLWMCQAVYSGAPQGNDPLIGQTAPAFKLPAHTGGEISLDQFRGKQTVVLAFYPKDFTGG